jgi:NAD-dependent SIR2 family protein deacetylase
VATHVVRVHAISTCDQDGRDADGNYCWLRCAVCLSQMRAEIARSLEELNRRFIPQCESCGAPMVRVSDVVRQVEELK